MAIYKWIFECPVCGGMTPKRHGIESYATKNRELKYILCRKCNNYTDGADLK